MTDVRSFRRVFDLERRIYTIDRLRLNPGGVPVRGVVYFLVSILTAFALGGLPITRLALHAIPWYLRDLALPGCAAAVLTAIRVDGRTAHLAVRAAVRLWVAPRRVSGLQRSSSVGVRWRPPELLLLPDGSDPRARALRYRGPGAVRVLASHALARSSPTRLTLVARSHGGARGQVVELAGGTELRVERERIS